MSETLVSVQEYLHESYDPDCDYVDGVVEERNWGELEHSSLQGEIGFWVGVNLKSVGIRGLLELTTKVTPTRYRVSDITLLYGKYPRTGILESPALAIIEILSPEDRFVRMQSKMDDYLRIGVRCCWLINPQTRRAWVYTATGSTELHDLVLRCENPAFEIPLKEIFQAIDEQTE